VRSLVARSSASITTVVGVVLVLGLGGAGTAGAATGSAVFGVQSHMRLAITGPVGMIAIVLGVGGLIVGLVRHRRAAAARSTTEASQRATERVRPAGVGVAAPERMPTQI
jgi:hypothetical protein